MSFLENSCKYSTKNFFFFHVRGRWCHGAPLPWTSVYFLQWWALCYIITTWPSVRKYTQSSLHLTSLSLPSQHGLHQLCCSCLCSETTLSHPSGSFLSVFFSLLGLFGPWHFSHWLQAGYFVEHFSIWVWCFLSRFRLHIFDLNLSCIPNSFSVHQVTCMFSLSHY